MSDDLRSYVNGWSRQHLHFGLFEPGESPAPGEPLVDSPVVERALERMIEADVAAADIDEHDHVVDAGCGVGGTAIYLAKTKGCTVTGVNVSRSQLEIAATKVAEAGMEDRICFEYADCSLSLPFADSSIDVVVCIESACHYRDRGQFLLEVHRILRPSGKLVAGDWMARDGVSEEEYERFIVPLCGAYGFTDLETESSYTAKLHEAGLEVLAFEGYEGKEAENLRLTERLSELSRNAAVGRSKDARNSPRMINRCATLCEAWKNGAFEKRRFCAQKPA